MIRILPALLLVAAVMACDATRGYFCDCPMLCDSLLGRYWYPEEMIEAESARKAEDRANELCLPHAEAYCVDSEPSCECTCGIPH